MNLDALFEAIEKSDIETIKSLIDKDKNLVNQFDDHGDTSLLHAIKADCSLEMIKLLLSKGADVNVTDEFGNTSLHIVASYGDLDIAELLIVNFAMLDIQDSWGNTALISSIINHHYAISKILIYNNADVHLANYYGNDALFFAKQRDCKEIVELLIMRVAELN